MYTLNAKLAHGLYHDATVVDYNLSIKVFKIEDARHPASARLHVE